MSRRRGQRGVALAWAVMFSTLLALAAAGVAAGLARQAEAVRLLKADAAREDLLRAGRAWAAAGGRGTLDLAGGRVEVVARDEGGLALVVTLPGFAPEAPVPLQVDRRGLSRDRRAPSGSPRRAGRRPRRRR